MLDRPSIYGSTYLQTESWNELTVRIVNFWDKGYQLVDIETAPNLYWAVFQKDDDLTNSTYVHEASYDEMNVGIRKFWDLGYDLVGMDQGDGHWTAVMVDSSKIHDSGYDYATNYHDLMVKVNEMSVQGFQLQDMTVNGDFSMWAVVYVRSTDILKSEKRLHLSPSEFEREGTTWDVYEYVKTGCW